MCTEHAAHGAQDTNVTIITKRATRCCCCCYLLRRKVISIR